MTFGGYKTQYVLPPELRRTRVKRCGRYGCDHEFQDGLYGKNRRVMNRTKDGWRCTVCGTTTRI